MLAKKTTRRSMLKAGGVVVAAGLIRPITAFAQAGRDGQRAEAPVSPVEDLMREHDVAGRVLVVFSEAATKLQDGKDFPMQAIADGASVIQRFVVQYHVPNEESQVFPVLEKNGKMKDMIGILRAQHQVAADLANQIATRARAGAKSESDRKEFAALLTPYIAMMNAHTTREGTELYPAFSKAISKQQVQEMAQRFEESERRQLGENGFEKMVSEVIQVEKTAGLGDLGKFTSRAQSAEKGKD